jgi:hypothetical protein
MFLSGDFEIDHDFDIDKHIHALKQSSCDRHSVTVISKAALTTSEGIGATPVAPHK